MRTLALVGVTLLSACGSSQSANPAGGTVQVVQPELGIYSGDITVDNVAATAIVDGSPDELWPRLAAVHRDLGLGPNYVDPDKKSLGAVNVRLTRIAGERMSKFFDCGRSLAGPNANLYDVFVSAVSQLAPAGSGGTAVRIEASAVGRSREHGVAPVNCTSTHDLERVILGRLGSEATVQRIER